MAMVAVLTYLIFVATAARYRSPAAWANAYITLRQYALCP